MCSRWAARQSHPWTVPSCEPCTCASFAGREPGVFAGSGTTLDRLQACSRSTNQLCTAHEPSGMLLLVFASPSSALAKRARPHTTQRQALSPPLRVQVVFRHGARTPLTPKYWEGTRWDVCGEAFAKAPLTVRDHDTGEAQPECIDGDKLTHYDGGCTRGELTKLGQVQVRGSSARCSTIGLTIERSQCQCIHTLRTPARAMARCITAAGVLATRAGGALALLWGTRLAWACWHDASSISCQNEYQRVFDW